MRAHCGREKLNRGAWRTEMAAGGRSRPRRVFSGQRVMGALASAADKTMCALLRAAIVAYQMTVSPLLGKHCRFYPSCSHYILTAIERHGLLKGSFLGACRLMRCNGFFHGGYDPVPGDDALTHASPRGGQFNFLHKGW